MRATALTLACLLAACSNNKDPGDGVSPVSDTGDDGTGGSDGTGGTSPTGQPELATTNCDGEPYEFLPLDDMGTLVEYERDAFFSLSKDALEGLITTVASEYADLIEVQYGVELYRIRYLTQDRGELVETTGFAAYPALDEPTSVPVQLWLHPTLGFGDECAPTAGSGLDNIEGIAFPVLFASQGYAIAAPDYLGMNGWGEPSDRMHSWVVAEPTALASLDSVRALARLAEAEGLVAQPDLQRLLPVGASQGGHAALMVDHYAQGYAPEMGLIGVVAAIPVTDLEALAQFGASTESEASIGLAGGMVTHWDWNGRNADLTDVLQEPVANALAESLEGACGDYDDLVPGVETLDDIYTEEALALASVGDFDNLEPWNCYMRNSSLLHNEAVDTLSSVPKLVVTGEEDDLAWAPPARADAEALCAAGVEVEYHECAGLGHVDAAVENLPRIVDWMAARVQGEPVDACAFGEPIDCAAYGR